MVYEQKQVFVSFSNPKKTIETAILLRDFIGKKRLGGRRFVKNIFREFDGDKSMSKSALFELCFGIITQDYLQSRSKLAILESQFRVEPHFKHMVSKILENNDLLKNDNILSMFAMIINKMYK